MPTIADDWKLFTDDWCLGVPPTAGHASSIRALDALERYLPEYMVRTLGHGAKGIGVLFWPLEIGGVIADTEGLRGFSSVIKRVRDGERSALSELRFAAKLCRSGLTPWLHAEIAGKTLDLGVEVGNVTVFVEVVRPDRSDMDKDAHERVTRARERLGQRDGLHVIVELLTFPSDEIVETVRRAMDGSPLGQWFEMPGAARWRLDEHPQGGRSGEFKWPANEHRAHRLISDEYGHFAADVPYVLAVDTNATLLSPEGWSEAFVRCFQPLRNRRLGATIAYREYSLAAADPLRTLACLRINPHATRQIPVELVRLLEALHQPIAVSAA